MKKSVFQPTAKNSLSALFLCAVLASCGGGDSGSSSPPPTSISTAPRFTSSASVSVVENTEDVFYTATATDPQGDQISFSIFGGADADKFVVSSTGALRFNSNPNYDLPTDSGQDNIFDLTLRATAAGESVSLALRVAVTNDREGVAVRRVAEGIVDPVDMAFIHNETTLLVAERNGRVLRVNPANGAIAEDTFIRDNRVPGLNLAVAFAFPDRTRQEGVYLLTHSDTDGLWLQGFDGSLSATGFAKLGGPMSGDFAASLIAQGELYIAIGDPDGNNAQNLSSPYGKLFQQEQADPFGGASLRPVSELIVRPDIIGDGIQNPGGFSAAADFLYLADSGSSREHELTIFRRDWRPLDFGWPFYEGTQATGTNPPAAINGPTLAYNVGAAGKEGTGIVAGILNNANFFEALGSTYIFADKNGTIWSVARARLTDGFLHRANEFEDRSEDFIPDVGSIDSPIAFAPGFGADHFYILDSDGEIFRVEEQ